MLEEVNIQVYINMHAPTHMNVEMSLKNNNKYLFDSAISIKESQDEDARREKSLNAASLPSIVFLSSHSH
jgi:hypothetical protein